MQPSEPRFKEEDEATIADANRRLQACVSSGFGILPRLSFDFAKAAETAREVLGLTDSQEIYEFVRHCFEHVCQAVSDLQPGDCLLTGGEEDALVIVPTLQAFVCTDHDGVYLSGASVVFAASEAEAQTLLDAQLVAYRLASSAEKPYTLRTLPLTPGAHILNDGDY